MLFNERIATQSTGETQILFVDASTLSVASNSDMVIDQFVFDPHAGTGKLAASLTRGVFRFVGGALSKNDNAVTMRTPTATIGIRGGIVLVNVQPDCGAPVVTPGCNALEVIFGYGQSVTVTGLNGISQTITRPGFAVTVAARGAAPSAPAPAPRGTMAALLTKLAGRPGSHGGATRIPTETVVAKSGVSTTISTNAAPGSPAGGRSQPPSATTVIQQTQLNIQLVSTQNAVTTSENQSKPPPPPKVPPTVTSSSGEQARPAGAFGGFAGQRSALSGLFGPRIPGQ